MLYQPPWDITSGYDMHLRTLNLNIIPTGISAVTDPLSRCEFSESCTIRSMYSSSPITLGLDFVPCPSVSCVQPMGVHDTDDRRALLEEQDDDLVGTIARHIMMKEVPVFRRSTEVA
jgi:hypothetical protein